MAPKVSQTLPEHGCHFRDVDRLLNTPCVVDALRCLEATGFAGTGIAEPGVLGGRIMYYVG